MSKVEQWARVRRLGDGDDMRAASLDFSSEDRRDATYIRYDLIEDLNERYPNRPPLYADEPTAFFGQLLHILVVRLPPAQITALRSETTYILAAVHRCVVSARNSMDMPIYDRMGRIEVVDITSVQCLIGRVPVGTQWAIIDRTGEVQQSVHVRDD
ncbi:hypothetical protein FA13DRAFT_1654378 [Coprinellus micaceus]|uniref:Uncharacterized protein n=1 Tax=Coprinellus micaceus TaxID=71717 RepID=A0A4Y7RBM1_COPMI|nr:hypothetical protein FA13DRAFT_1654378 [Coprinellus micaceus]